jgi:hypothetical protein
MRQLSNDTQLIRAARELMQVYGSQAAAVAEKRAIHLDESGETLTATTWRQIGDAVRRIEARVSPGHSVLAQ